MVISNPKDFYWERIFICSLAGGGGGAAIAYLLGVEYFTLVFLGVAIGIALSTIMQTDKVSGIKSVKKEPEITLQKIQAKQFKEQMPDDIKGLKS